MDAKLLNQKINQTAQKLQKKLKDIPLETLHLILWNLFREKKDPGDFLLKKVGKNRWAR